MIGGLEHRGVLHESADDLVAALLPDLRAALDAGDAVVLVVDRRTAREVREALGEDAAAVAFPVPADVFRAGPADALRRLRSWVAPGRRTLVVGHYPAVGTTVADHAVVEEGVDLVLADLPLTVLCTCPRDADPAALARLRRHHGRLHDGGEVVDNPEHRSPADRSPVPAALWGPPVLRAGFRELADLRALRARVAGATAEAGLAGDAADAALLAVHEAAVLACAMREDSGAECTVEVRAGDGAMVTEVIAPGTGPADADPLAVLRLFSRETAVDTVGADRRIRLLSTA